MKTANECPYCGRIPLDDTLIAHINFYHDGVHPLECKHEKEDICKLKNNWAQCINCFGHGRILNNKFILEYKQ